MPRAEDGTEYDGFGDITSSETGIFQGLGLKRHDSVSHEMTQHGLVLEFFCQGCGSSKQMIVTYPELVAMKYGVNPALAFQGIPGIDSWQFVQQEQAWRPQLQCHECQFHIPLRVQPNECERHLQVARRRGFLNPETEQKLSNRASQIAATRAR